MSDFEYEHGSGITFQAGAYGGLTLDSVDTFRELAAEGDRLNYYSFAAARVMPKSW